MEDVDRVHYDEESADEDYDSDSSYASSYDEEKSGNNGALRTGVASASQPSNAAPVPPIPLVPGLRSRGQQQPHPSVPALGLRRPAADGVASTPRGDGCATLHARSSPPGESSAGPRSKHPPSGGDVRPPSLRLGAKCGQLNAMANVDGSASASGLSVSLVSPAFMLEREALDRARCQGEPRQVTIGKRIGEKLGVRAEDMAFYELRAVEGEPQAAHVAVVINHSDFSLGALEGILGENRRLRQAVDGGALEQAVGTSRRLDSAMGPLTARQPKHVLKDVEVEAQRLRERCQMLEREVSTLRQQLQRSDGLRLQGQKALDELKAEFMALTRDLAADPVASWSAAPSSILSGGGSGITSSEGHQAKEAPVSQIRLANVLEKLCDNSVLSHLERCLDRMGTN